MKKILAIMVFMFLLIPTISSKYNPDTPVSSDYTSNITTTSVNIDDEEISCPEYYSPVCAQPPMPECPEGMMCIQMMPPPKTYSNECFAWLDKAEILYEWICEGDNFNEELIICTMEYDPVCWVDGKTYWNRCVAELQNKVEVLYVWECSDYVDIKKFNLYKKYDTYLKYLLSKKEDKQLENAIEKIDDMIKATKLQKSAMWIKVERITALTYLKEIISNELNFRKYN